jgi:hypothetical protein
MIIFREKEFGNFFSISGDLFLVKIRLILLLRGFGGVGISPNFQYYKIEKKEEKRADHDVYWRRFS